jgi:TPP-dependent pyruvate/acetoin dehydrogenase alpha subunit
MKEVDLSIVKKILWLRLAQMTVNELYKNKEFVVPIHLALGHESLAVAVDSAMGGNDNLFLSHRNIHYNLTKMQSLKEELDEYYLRKSGIGKGQLGSMNLFNKDKNISYASSILGNNLPVGCGFALGNKIKNENGVVFIVTGDGAVEEGAFYESLLFLKSNALPAVIIIENNDWSLATKTNERRAMIDFAKLADSLDIEYLHLQGNDPFIYQENIKLLRERALQRRTPVLLEVKLTTLGYWHMEHPDFPDGKFINYHCGPAPEVHDKEYPLIEASEDDPLHVLMQYLPTDELVKMSNKQATLLKEEIK